MPCTGPPSACLLSPLLVLVPSYCWNMSPNISGRKFLWIRNPFRPQWNKPDILPALLITSSDLSAGIQLTRIAGPGFSLVRWKCTYFRHRLSWRISLFQKTREAVGSFIKKSLREPVMARLSRCGWQLAFRTGWMSVPQCCPLTSWQPSSRMKPCLWQQLSSLRQGPPEEEFVVYFSGWWAKSNWQYVGVINVIPGWANWRRRSKLWS